MADPEALYRLKAGKLAWSDWRYRNEVLRPNLNEEDLSGAELQGFNLTSADLRSSYLRNACLREARLSQANLMGADLSGADLSGARLRFANLIDSKLDNAILTDAKLWETQRAGWSIKGVVCERAYWDRKMEEPTEYASGEFERLYSEQTSIELFYCDGISTFELSTLPALLYHLSSKYPDTNIRLQTIEETSGGAKIKISLGDADEQTKQAVLAAAVHVQHIQLALRESEGRRLQLEANYNQMLETFTKTLLASVSPQITFNAPVHTAALPSGSAKVELHQTFNDNTELIQLIDKLLTRNTELTVPQSVEIEAAKAELQKPEPDKSLLTRTLGFLKTLPKEALLKGAGKLGERAAEADWSNLLHQLGEFIHHPH